MPCGLNINVCVTTYPKLICGPNTHALGIGMWAIATDTDIGTIADGGSQLYFAYQNKSAWTKPGSTWDWPSYTDVVVLGVLYHEPSILLRLPPPVHRMDDALHPRQGADMTLEQLLKKAYLEGFNASAEGYNAEYGVGEDPRDNAKWTRDRDKSVADLLQWHGLTNHKDIS